MEFVDVLRQHGAEPKPDMHALWRRIVFNILISNTDDHLRNHGFLYGGPAGWRLAPAYDLNPVPVDIKPHVLSTAIDLDDGTASLKLALSVVDYFDWVRTKRGGAQPEWARRFPCGARKQQRLASRSRMDIERMASAFEYEELKRVLSSTSTVRKAKT